MHQSRNIFWPVIIWYCIVLHAVWGVCILIEPAAAGVTAASEITALTGSPRLSAFLFLIVAALAAVGLLRRGHPLVRVLEMIPQQLVLMASAFGALAAVYHHAFSDGVPRPALFIFSDQFPAMAIAVAHTIAILRPFLHRSDS